MLDFARLPTACVAIQEEFQGQHESKDEEAEELCLQEMAGSNAEKNADDHDDGAHGGGGSKGKNAGGTAQIGGRIDPESETGQNDDGINWALRSPRTRART